MNDTIDIKSEDQLHSNWNYPTTIRFGAGRATELAEACKSINIKKPLLVTDQGLAKIDFVEALLQQCLQANLAAQLFHDVKPNPSGSNIEAGVKAFLKGGHDGVIALGGGSALDAGKAIALMSGQQRSIWDFEDIGDNWSRVDPDGIAPIIAIPTTAGTGSEVGRASVIVDESQQLKKIIFHPKMLPTLVIADPKLTTGLPAPITAATGLDALVHNLEAYCAPGYHPMADGIALEAMRLIKNWLPKAYENGNNLIARSHMLAASTMGATAFQKGLGGVHALAHPLGALYDKHHGLLNAILLPYVLQKNRPVIEDRISHVSLCLELDDLSFEGFLQWILKLREKLQIPHSLKEIGINSNNSQEIGQRALQDPSAVGNPLALNAEQYSEIFTRAVNGELY